MHGAWTGLSSTTSIANPVATLAPAPPPRRGAGAVASLSPSAPPGARRAGVASLPALMNNAYAPVPTGGTTAYAPVPIGGTTAYGTSAAGYATSPTRALGYIPPPGPMPVVPSGAAMAALGSGSSMEAKTRIAYAPTHAQGRPSVSSLPSPAVGGLTGRRGLSPAGVHAINHTGVPIAPAGGPTYAGALTKLQNAQYSAISPPHTSSSTEGPTAPPHRRSALQNAALGALGGGGGAATRLASASPSRPHTMMPMQPAPSWAGVTGGAHLSAAAAANPYAAAAARARSLPRK